MKLNVNKSRLAVPDYTIGQQVWLATKNLWLTRTSQKLTERWLGPYTIIGLAGPNAVKLKLLTTEISADPPHCQRLTGQTLSRAYGGANSIPPGTGSHDRRQRQQMGGGPHCGLSLKK